MKRVWIATRIVLGGILFYAGVLKAVDPGAFALALEHYRLFPAPLLAPLAFALPWLEIVCGGALVLNRFTLGAASLSTLLCVGFVAALGSAWVRGLDIDCGCFGRSGDDAPAGTAWAVLRSVVLLGLSAALGVNAWRNTRTSTR